MRTVLVAAALALAAAAPAAAAGHHEAQCGSEPVPAAGGGYKLVGYGVIAGAPGDVVSLSCAFYAGPHHVLTTAHRPGEGVAVTYGRAPWHRGAGDRIDKVCYAAVVNGVADDFCADID